MRKLLVAVCVLCWSSFAYAEQPDAIINLWPGEPPGQKIEAGPEQDMTKDTDALIAGRRIIKLGNVTVPQAHVYLPPANLRTGASVVICPGGGYSILAWDLEGTEVAQWLNTQGVAAIVLKYRVPTTMHEQSWLASTQDAQRTISMVRSRANKWNLNKDKVAILGFSAGGATSVRAMLAKQRYYEAIDDDDQESFLPNRVILVYTSGLASRDAKNDDIVLNVTERTPPVFMAHAFDDFVPVEGTAKLLLAMKQAGVPAELHVYDAGGHGYGLRQREDYPVTHWTKPCEDWLKRGGWIYNHSND